eukprot:37274_1
MHQFFYNLLGYPMIYIVIIFSGIQCSALKSGVTLTLNPCGEYDQYQKWKWQDSTDPHGGLLSLSSYPNACLECSGFGYCKPGMKPQINICNNNTNTQKFLSWGPNIKVNSLCLQYIGLSEFSSIQIIQCDIGYYNDMLQDFYIDHISGYIHANDNLTLCVTAMYYPIKNCSDTPLNNYKYCNQNLTIDERVNDLVNRMTIYEKIDNLDAGSNIGVPRLGIPPNSIVECLHGVKSDCGATYNGNTGCPTSFPNPLLLGATFNRSLWNLIGKTISTEGRALFNQGIGGLFCLSPNINLFRYPTWGRGQEVPSEDPFLTSQYAIEYITGLQWNSTSDEFQLDDKYLKMSTTVKHYADYDLEGCRYGIPCRKAFNAIVSKQDQKQYYWPVWKSAVQIAKAQSLMCSYNAINGVASCGNNEFLNNVARNEWGFNGFIMSDSSAIIDDAFTVYVEANTNGEDDPIVRVKLALENGCDTDLGDAFYISYLYYALVTNAINMTIIDKAVSRFMKVSFMLGQMDNPGPEYKYYGKQYVDTNYNRKLAQNAAEQGIVVLKNKNNILPLSDKNMSYGFIGPHFNIT